jgi:hypothetical protein
MLRQLRAINRQILDETLGHYLTARQLDAVEARRVLIVEHYDQAIAKNGEDAVLYDLSPRQ